MKKLLAVAAIALGLSSITTSAQAWHGGGVRVYVGPGYHWGYGPRYYYGGPYYYRPYYRTYYRGGCRWIPGHYNYYGYWIPGRRVCW